MNITTPLPSLAELKAQAKRMRSDLAATGHPISHAQALENIAHQWGMRDWNTLHARAAVPNLRFAPLQTISGRYLGHAFTGKILAARSMHGGFWALTLQFDEAIDVVTSAHFSSLRRRVNCTVNAAGQSAQTTSDGQPHVVLDLPK